MSIWDDITKGATDAANFAVKKTGEMTSLAKLKLALHTEESKLTECYVEIGKLYYTYHREGKDVTAEIDSRLTDADAVLEKIATIKSEIADIQDSVLCASCGSKINKDFEFCPICGTKQAADGEKDGE